MQRKHQSLGLFNTHYGSKSGMLMRIIIAISAHFNCQWPQLPLETSGNNFAFVSPLCDSLKEKPPGTSVLKHVFSKALNGYFRK